MLAREPEDFANRDALAIIDTLWSRLYIGASLKEYCRLEFKMTSIVKSWKYRHECFAANSDQNFHRRTEIEQSTSYIHNGMRNR